MALPAETPSCVSSPPPPPLRFAVCIGAICRHNESEGRHDFAALWYPQHNWQHSHTKISISSTCYSLSTTDGCRLVRPIGRNTSCCEQSIADVSSPGFSLFPAFRPFWNDGQCIPMTYPSRQAGHWKTQAPPCQSPVIGELQSLRHTKHHSDGREIGRPRRWPKLSSLVRLVFDSELRARGCPDPEEMDYPTSGYTQTGSNPMMCSCRSMFG